MAAVQGINVRIGKKHLFYLSVSRFLVFLLLLSILCFTVLPLVYVVTTSFKPLHELFAYPPKFFVHQPTLNNFSDLFSTLGSVTVPFTRYIFNSIITSGTIVFLTVIVSCMAAYGLVKHHPAGSDFIFSLVIAALMFNTHVTQIPNYVIVRGLGLLNSYWALILPKIAVAFNVFLVKQFLEQMPNAFLEAARIDGASEWTIFWRIVMPFLRPSWATLIVFSFVANWNDYFSPLVFITDDSMKTLPLAVQSIAGGPGAAAISTAGAMAAATFILTLPTIIVYMLMQGKVLNTMGYSGIKA